MKPGGSSSCQTSASSGDQNNDGALGIGVWHSAPPGAENNLLNWDFRPGQYSRHKEFSLPWLWKSKGTFPPVQTVTHNWPVLGQRRPEAISWYSIWPNQRWDWWAVGLHSFGSVIFQNLDNGSSDVLFQFFLFSTYLKISSREAEGQSTTSNM